jgi:hypothetical protein
MDRQQNNHIPISGRWKGNTLFSFIPIPRRSLHAVLLALMTALTLSSCVSGRPPYTESLAPFTSDGCSLFPDGTFKNRDKWCDCCQTHDLAYWQGGSADVRKKADETLRNCVLTRTGDQNLAEIMYLGGRAGTRPSPPGIGGATAGPMAAAISRYRDWKDYKLKNGSPFTRDGIRRDIALKKTRNHNVDMVLS